MKQTTQRFSALLRIWIMVLAMAAAFSCQSPKPHQVTSLAVEYLTNPLGVDVPQPRFSWKIESEERDVAQVAWQIIVGESEKDVRRGTGDAWDSGKVVSDASVQIAWGGNALKSNTKYYWKVGVWTNDGEPVWSEPAFFHTGLLNADEWKAQWITTAAEIVNASPLMRKEFEAEKSIKEAYAYVTAAGIYELHLNGQKVGDHVLDPGVTDYRETVLYSVYDVTELMEKGTNTVGAMLGNGAWNLRDTPDRYSWGRGNASLGNPCLIVQLMITYADGSQSVVVSDDSWKTGEGPISFNNLYGGEDYDANKEPAGWSASGFDDNAWQQVVIAANPGGRLKSQLTPPIKVTDTIVPVAQTNPGPGVFLFDLGQNIAGWWKLEIRGTPGMTVRIRGSETLNDSLFSEPLEEGDKMSTKHRYHAEVWTDYTLKGSDTEVYEPRFFYTGMRYIEVTTSDQSTPAHLGITGRVVRSANPRNSWFESSDSLLNRIYRAGVWSQMGNMQSYPTDCPHREKGAYNGDGQVIAETSMHDFEMAPFYTKWLNDMRDSQQDNGRIPNTSPVLVGGMGGGVAWGSAYILIPYWMQHYYGDTRILEDHYPAMKRYLAYLKALGSLDEDPKEPWIIDNFDGYWYSLGEWCAPEQRDCPIHAVVNTFYYYHNNLLLSKIAGTLGNTDEQAYYAAQADTIRENFNRRFFDPETGLYGTQEAYQTYQLLALVGDMVPDGYRDKVFQTVVDDIRARGNHLNTGIIGTKYLWPVLVQGGENELAYQVATQTTFPSFGYWIENGATTLLEEWAGVNSHNHQMFGSITEYFFKFLAGIQSPMEGTAAGYKDIRIEPHVPAGLDHARASVGTVAGTVLSDWQKDAGSFTLQVTIPANTRGTVVLPLDGGREFTVFEGSVKLWENNQVAENVPGIASVTQSDGKLEVAIGSGSYAFRVEYK